MKQMLSTGSVQSVQSMPGRTIHRQSTVIVDKEFHSLVYEKIVDSIWLGVHLFGSLLFFRMIFALFDARLSGFSLMIFKLTSPYVWLFKGIFPTPSSGEAYFDTAAFLGLGVWYLMGYAVTYMLYLISVDADEI